MILKILDKELEITDKRCLRCGTHENITRHHAIPQYIKPLENVVIPLCEECHKMVHAQEMMSTKAMLHKVERLFIAIKEQFVKKQKKHDEMTIADIIKGGKK